MLTARVHAIGFVWDAQEGCGLYGVSTKFEFVDRRCDSVAGTAPGVEAQNLGTSGTFIGLRCDAVYVVLPAVGTRQCPTKRRQRFSSILVLMFS